MYTLDHLRRVQDYILRNPDLTFYVFHSPLSPRPDLLGDVTYRTSPYVQKGSILVLDMDGAHEVIQRLSASEQTEFQGQHALFNQPEEAIDYWPVGDGLRGLAAREVQ